MRPRGSKAKLEERRRTAIKLLKHYGVREVARRVGASPGSVDRWKKMYEEGGARALRAKPDLGATPRLSPSDQARLTTFLLEGATRHGYATELWTLDRVAQVIQRKFGVVYGTTGVWLLLHRLGWSCQKPERRARERNESEIERWRRVTWPKLRKRSGA